MIGVFKEQSINYQNQLDHQTLTKTFFVTSLIEVYQFMVFIIIAITFFEISEMQMAISSSFYTFYINMPIRPGIGTALILSGI
jgi:hypothetical protein